MSAAPTADAVIAALKAWRTQDLHHALVKLGMLDGNEESADNDRIDALSRLHTITDAYLAAPAPAGPAEVTDRPVEPIDAIQWHADGIDGLIYDDRCDIATRTLIANELHGLNTALFAVKCEMAAFQKRGAK